MYMYSYIQIDVAEPYKTYGARELFLSSSESLKKSEIHRKEYIRIRPA